mmetsp:Transcript_2486/g.7394  ORF Transcript_2486/g.7394 Transcript_2486/m.7394 type:complete len:217 (+) Transcript_2486:1486-2136(+)
MAPTTPLSRVSDSGSKSRRTMKPLFSVSIVAQTDIRSPPKPRRRAPAQKSGKFSFSLWLGFSARRQVAIREPQLRAARLKRSSPMSRLTSGLMNARTVDENSPVWEAFWDATISHLLPTLRRSPKPMSGGARRGGRCSRSWVSMRKSPRSSDWCALKSKSWSDSQARLGPGFSRSKRRLASPEKPTFLQQVTNSFSSTLLDWFVSMPLSQASRRFP